MKRIDVFGEPCHPLELKVEEEPIPIEIRYQLEGKEAREEREYLYPCASHMFPTLVSPTLMNYVESKKFL